MINYKVKIFLLPWLVILLLCVTSMAVVYLLEGTEKTRMIGWIVPTGGILASVLYNIYQSLKYRKTNDENNSLYNIKNSIK